LIEAIAGLIILVFSLLGYNKHVSNKAKKYEQGLANEKKAREHDNKIADINDQRQKTKKIKVEEMVDDAKTNKFSDYYDDNN